MKREWSQNWPDLIMKLSEISQKGVRHIALRFTPDTDHSFEESLIFLQPSQLFTVLRILLFLAEEVTNLDGDLPPARRKDLMSALMVILESLFKFFVQTLQCSVEKMKQMAS